MRRFVLLFVALLAFPTSAAHGVTVKAGPELKLLSIIPGTPVLLPILILGGIVDVSLNKEIYVRGEAACVVSLVDFSVELSVRPTKNFNLFLRFHRLRAPNLWDGGFIWISAIDPGARLRVWRRFWIEGGAWGLMIPYVGLALY